MTSSPLCCILENITQVLPKDGVAGCQKMKMYSSDPDIAV